MSKHIKILKSSKKKERNEEKRKTKSNRFTELSQKLRKMKNKTEEIHIELSLTFSILPNINTILHNHTNPKFHYIKTEYNFQSVESN